MNSSEPSGSFSGDFSLGSSSTITGSSSIGATSSTTGSFSGDFSGVFSFGSPGENKRISTFYNEWCELSLPQHCVHDLLSFCHADICWIKHMVNLLRKEWIANQTVYKRINVKTPVKVFLFNEKYTHTLHFQFPGFKHGYINFGTLDQRLSNYWNCNGIIQMGEKILTLHTDVGKARVFSSWVLGNELVCSCIIRSTVINGKDSIDLTTHILEL